MTTNYLINSKAVKIARHIFDARIDNAKDRSQYLAYCTARDVFEYVLANNLECLYQFDDSETKEEREARKNV